MNSHIIHFTSEADTMILIRARMKQLNELAMEYSAAEAQQIGMIFHTGPIFDTLDVKRRKLHRDYETVKSEILGLV